MDYKIEHIGVIVNNIDEAIKLYRDMLSLTPWDMGVATIPKDGLKNTMLPLGNKFIELIEPIEKEDGSESRFAKHLRERGEGLFQLSVFTDDYDKDIQRLKGKGYLIEEEILADLFPGSEVRLAWLRPEKTRGVWIEFVDVTGLPESVKPS